MDKVVQVIKSVFANFDEHRLREPFQDIGVDSFELVVLRLDIESKMGFQIPDTDWVRFRNFHDIVDFFKKGSPSKSKNSTAGDLTKERHYLLNMPQMAIGGLSENWLFKELGDLHWSMISSGLRQKSDAIADSLGNRLYPTFVRIRWEGKQALQDFKENDEISISSSLSRFGKSIFFSDSIVQGAERSLRGTLMTTFALRQTDNKSLLKGEPTIPADSSIEEKLEKPVFSEEYREMRKGSANSHCLLGQKFQITSDVLFERPYELNPYADMNGVNLLYFAAYPMISDICEREFVHAGKEFTYAKDWALTASTVARDIFYYGNCDVEDSLLYRAHVARQDEKLFSIHCSISRRSDGQKLADIFTVKALKNVT